MKDELLRANQRSADEVADRIRHAVPVDTGRLRDSIAVTGPGQSTPAFSQPGGERVAGELEVIVTVGGVDARHPHLVEYGTAHSAAHPFFWPQIRLLLDRIRNRGRRAGAAALKKVAS